MLRNFLSHFSEMLLNASVGQSLYDSGVELCNEAWRRTSRSPQAVPNRNVESRRTCLIDARNVRRRGNSLVRSYRVRANCPCAEMRQGECRLWNHEIDLTREQVLHSRRAAAIRNELDLRASDLLEKNAGNMCGTARPDRRHRGLALAFFQPGNQFMQILGGYIALRDDQLRVGRDQRDWLEVGHDVEWQRINRAIEDVRAREANSNGVAIRCRTREAANTNIASAARHILDNDGLAQSRAHVLRECARNHVGRTAGRNRNDERDRARFNGPPSS
jgi:hypothetical protein